MNGYIETACTKSCVLPKAYQRSQHCRVCHQSFSSTAAGDRHRAGSFGSETDPRRCRDVTELEMLGLVLNDRGVWGRKAPISLTGFGKDGLNGSVPSADTSASREPRNGDHPRVVA